MLRHAGDPARDATRRQCSMHPGPGAMRSRKRPKMRAALTTAALALALSGSAMAQGKTLRLLTWTDYVPAGVQAQFEKETGYKVEVTTSSNEEMISKLRATEGPAFDLAQPSLERIAGVQRELRLYRPLDLGKVKTELFMPSILAATKRNSTVDGKVHGLPHVWGTDGLVVNTKLAKISNYPDLCQARYKGKTALRLRRMTLLAFAFAAGRDPFALYGNPKAYGAMMDEVGKTLIACKANVKFWDNRDQLLYGMRTERIVGAMAWDSGGWTLGSERSEIRYLAPRSGALGWIDTFAIPARGANDEAAYAWINFNLRPDIAAKVAAATGNVTASRGAQELMDARFKAQFAASFPPAALNNIKWYPAVPAELEEIEGRVLERIKNAK